MSHDQKAGAGVGSCLVCGGLVAVSSAQPYQLAELAELRRHSAGERVAVQVPVVWVGVRANAQTRESGEGDAAMVSREDANGVGLSRV